MRARAAGHRVPRRADAGDGRLRGAAPRRRAERIGAVVFVTAYDSYALRAFEVARARLPAQAVRRRTRFRARSRGRRRACASDAPTGSPGELLGTLGPRRLPDPTARPPYLRRLAIKADGRVILLPVEDVDWIEAADYCVRIHAGGTCASAPRADQGAGGQARPPPVLPGAPLRHRQPVADTASTTPTSAVSRCWPCSTAPGSSSAAPAGTSSIRCSASPPESAVRRNPISSLAAPIPAFRCKVVSLLGTAASPWTDGGRSSSVPRDHSRRDR